MKFKKGDTIYRALRADDTLPRVLEVRSMWSELYLGDRRDFYLLKDPDTQRTFSENVNTIDSSYAP